MPRAHAQLTLAALLAVACSEGATAPRDNVPNVTPNIRGEDLVLCSNPRGSVFVRPDCLANEEQLDPVALGLVRPPGPPGPLGLDVISGYEIVSHQEFLPGGAIANVHVDCPTGKKVLGGGFSIETPTDIRLFHSIPSDGSGNLIDDGWNVFVQNAGTLTRQTTVVAICASVEALPRRG